MEDKILGLYATRMTTRYISEQIKELYGVDISAELRDIFLENLLKINLVNNSGLLFY